MHSRWTVKKRNLSKPPLAGKLAALRRRTIRINQQPARSCVGIVVPGRRAIHVYRQLDVLIARPVCADGRVASPGERKDHIKWREGPGRHRNRLYRAATDK